MCAQTPGVPKADKKVLTAEEEAVRDALEQLRTLHSSHYDHILYSLRVQRGLVSTKPPIRSHGWRAQAS